MPEKVLKKINEKLLPQWKVCFLSALAVGFLAHFYKITNWLPNWDSLVMRYDDQNMMMTGRWFLTVVCGFSSFYDLPFLNGVLAIIIHGISAVCICRMLNVQKTITAFFLGAVIISFPTVTSVMMYNYVADGYSIAFLLSTLAAMYMTGEKPKCLLPAVMIALSAGIYQAYITVTIMLILLKLIDELVFGNVSFGRILKKAVRMLLTGIFGTALYAITLKILLGIFSVELLEYQGIGGAASLSGLDLRASLYIIKETFRKCFFDISQGINVYVVLNGVVLLVTALFYIGYIVATGFYKNICKLLLLMFLTVMLVVGAAALALINVAVDYHSLMRMGYSVFYVFFLLLYERGTEKQEKHTAIKCWTVLLTALVIVVNQIVISNVSYHKAQMAYERSYGVLIRIADRIEQTPGAEDCDKILVLGMLENSEQYSVNLTPEITGTTDGYIIRADDEMVGQSVLCSALSDYCEKNYTFVIGEEKRLLAQREEIRSMGTWPAGDCVTVVGDTVVIRLGAETEP